MRFLRLLTIASSCILAAPTALTYAADLTQSEQTCSAALGAGPLLWRSGPLAATKAAVKVKAAGVMPAYYALLADAEAALSQGPYSVTHKPSPPPGGDLNDYWSLAPYWWPDKKKKNGLPYVQRDGEVNPERNGDGFDRPRSLKMSKSVTALALAAYLSDDKRYGMHAAKLLHTWFVDPKTHMRPQLRYAQSIPGRTDGRAIGIIDTATYMELVDAILLLDSVGGLEPALVASLRGWFKDYVTWLTRNEMALEERAKRNNHGTFYDAQVTTFGLFSFQCGLAKRVVKDTQLRIDSQVLKDGQMPLELKRTRSLHYMVFNTQAFLAIARLNEHIGGNLYAYRSPTGASIFSPIQYMLPYASRPQDWPHEDIRRAAAAKELWRLLRELRLISDSPAIAKAVAGSPSHDAKDRILLLTYQPD